MSDATLLQTERTALLNAIEKICEEKKQMGQFYRMIQTYPFDTTKPPTDQEIEFLKGVLRGMQEP